MKTVQDYIVQILGSKDLQIAQQQARIDELEAHMAARSDKPTVPPKDETRP